MHTPDVVIFLHGRGMGPEAVSTVRGAFNGCELLAPKGGVVLKRGHTWFENERIGIANPKSLSNAETRFLRWCDSEPLDGRQAWLCGFSNGGALAAHMIIHHPERYNGVALLAAPLVLPPWPTGALSGKAVLYSHGDEKDEVVGQEFYAAAEKYLVEKSSATVTRKIYPSGHTVTAAMVEDLERWFASASKRNPLND